MRKLVLAACAAASLSACAQQPATPTAEETLARGQYLVEAIGGCHDCHTPMTPTGPDMSRALQGATLVFGPLIEIPWAPTAPEIAGIPAGYTEDQFVHLLQTGERPDGQRPRPPMPPYRLSEEDARAIVAYIKTVPKAQH